MELRQLVEQLDKFIGNADVKVEAVSKRGVDWHIDHCLKIIIVTCESLIDSKESEYKWKFNIYRSILLRIGYFPRGKVRAPRIVNNKEQIVISDLGIQVNNAKSLLKTVDRLNAKHNFPHPYFGLLNLKDSKRFLEVHTNHHIKIIKDILSHNK